MRQAENRSRLGREVHEPVEPRRAAVKGRMERGGVLWPAYAFAGRNLIRLLVPTLLVSLPVGALALLSLAPVVDGSAAVVNGAFELIGPPGPPLLVWSAAALLVSVVAQAVALPATVLLATGLMTGEPLSARDAMRAAVRRWPAMLVLALLGVSGFVTVAAAGLGILWWSGAQVTAYLVVAVLTLLTMPCLLAVPATLVEGLPVWRALGRAYRLTAGGFPPTAFTLAAGVLVLPLLVQRAVDWATGGTPVVAGSVLALLIPAFQATVIARQYLRRLAAHVTTATFWQTLDRLPSSGPRPSRPVPVLAALLLPGLLYVAAPLVNPFGWLEVTETTVAPDTGYGKDGRERPALNFGDLQALYAGRGETMVMLIESHAEATLLTCADSTCTRTRHEWAEPIGVHREPVAAGARLPDGRLVVTTWTQEGLDEDGQPDLGDWRGRLRLLTCDATTCAPAHHGRPLAETDLLYEGRLVALAARPGGGLVVVQAQEVRRQDREVVSVTVCDDPACTRRRTREVARLTARPSVYHRHHLVAAVGPGDRPVILRFDHDTGSVTVVSCDDPACARTRTGRPVTGERRSVPEEREPGGAAMAIRADGRPLIAYRDTVDGAVKLLDCRTRECSQADAATLSAPGWEPMAPAVVLDRNGRALVAYHDSDEQIVVATCTGTRCVHTPVAKFRPGVYESMAMALDSRGRPVIARLGGRQLVVTIPHGLP